MAIAQNLLSKFRSLRRPGLLSGASSSGTFSSYAKKQAAAEDLIYDNQYQDGLLSPESYLSKLQERMMRTWNTPRQVVSIQEQMKDVQVKVQDAEVSRAYQAGEIDTDTVLQHEQNRLNSMTADGSEAYIKQQQKVQSLIDKSEREKRAATRVAENLRISELPEDASANMWEKARLYQNLSEQARLDGDVQQADSLLAQANSYTSSAKRAEINDLISSTRLSVSETMGAGQGVPTAEGGYAKLFGSPGQGGSTGLGGTGTSAPGSVPAGFTSPAVKNALESLDRKYMGIERLYQQKQDRANLIATYREAVNRAEGDQKTQLTIQLNNLIEGDAQLDNQIDNATADINDIVVRIQEAQAKAAIANFSKQMTEQNFVVAQEENRIEKDFAKGKMGKEDYLSEAQALLEKKIQYAQQAADFYGQNGEDTKYEKYLQNVEDAISLHESITNIASNADDWEPIAADPQGNLTNISGKKVMVGDVALVNVRKLKDSGEFDTNYTFDADQGVFRAIQYPGVQKSNGEYYTKNDIKDFLASDAAQELGTEFAPIVYKTSSDGKVIQEKLKQYGTLGWITPKTEEVVKAENNKLFDKTLTVPKLIEDLKKGMQTTPAPSSLSGEERLFERITNPLQSLGTTVKNAASSAKNFVGSAVDKLKGWVGDAMSSIGSAKPGIEIPSLVKKAYAAEKMAGGNQDIESIIKSVFPQAQWDNALRVVQGESSGNPQAINAKNRNGSKDVGLFQINSIHFPWIQRKYGWTEKDLLDPVKNTIAAKDIYDQSQGWTPWVAAKKQGIKGYTPSPTPKPEEVIAAIGRVQGASIANPQIEKMPKIVQAKGADYSHYPTMTETSKDGRVTTTRVVQPVTPQPVDTYIPRFIPPENRHTDMQPIPGQPPKNFGEAINNAYWNITGKDLPKISLPKIELPKINLQPTVQKVQELAKPVTNFVSGAVSSAKNWLSSINPFKKK